MTVEAKPILEVRDLRIALPKGSDRPFALQGLNLNVHAGENADQQRNPGAVEQLRQDTAAQLVGSQRNGGIHKRGHQ